MNFIEFIQKYPSDEACLEWIFKEKHGNIKAKRLTGRLAYVIRKGRIIYPLKGTIFEKSRTPLTKWFYAIFLFSASRNSVSAKELQRQLGVTYKCAWRMCRQIRSLMKQEKNLRLEGTVEADETYIGGMRRLNSWKKPKTAVVGMLQRNGQVIAKAISGRSEYAIAPFVNKYLTPGSMLYTDGAPVYNTLRGYGRGRVLHTRKEYVKGDIHTNGIESFWSKTKGSIRGTHKWVSKRHLQSYVDYQAFMHNNRDRNMFEAIMEKV